jgi:replication-associated recombination protein RarA
MFYGDPGVGKSALADYLLSRLAVSKWSVTKLSGTQLRLEQIEDFQKTLCYREMFSRYRILRIEEMDRASHTARAGMLTMLDDLPDHVGVVCTTNKSIGEMEMRFLSRFQSIEVKPPTAAQIRELLSELGLRKDVVTRISEFACGNVRLALFEAQTALDQNNLSRLAA